MIKHIQNIRVPGKLQSITFSPSPSLTHTLTHVLEILKAGRPMTSAFILQLDGNDTFILEIELN